MPLCVLNEIALQPCGWLAAYLGSALRSEKDLRFRNLGGTAELSRDVSAKKGTLTTRARLTQVSEAGDMIIEHFDFQVLQSGKMIYQGRHPFRFFHPQGSGGPGGVAADRYVAIYHARGFGHRQKDRDAES